MSERFRLTSPTLAAMTSDADEAETLGRVDAIIETLPTADEPYCVANAVAGAASDALVTSITACRHYELWMGLTDWYELKPSETSEAVAAMRRAASEWLSVRDDPAEQQRYFERWRFELRALCPPITPSELKALAYLKDLPPED